MLSSLLCYVTTLNCGIYLSKKLILSDLGQVAHIQSTGMRGFAKCWLGSACALVQLTWLLVPVRMWYLVSTCQNHVTQIGIASLMKKNRSFPRMATMRLKQKFVMKKIVIKQPNLFWRFWITKPPSIIKKPQICHRNTLYMTWAIWNNIHVQ